MKPPETVEEPESVEAAESVETSTELVVEDVAYEAVDAETETVEEVKKTEE